jgi:hypothetical protein
MRSITSHVSRDGIFKLLRSPGTDFQPVGPVRQTYLSYWSARLHRLYESITRNRFLGSINVYKFRHRVGEGGVIGSAADTVYVCTYIVHYMLYYACTYCTVAKYKAHLYN